jgi:hypothetical protein
VTLVQTIGWAIGLALVSFGERVWALDIPSMASLLAFSVAAGGLCLLALPETRSRELEAISDEHAAEVPLA